MANVFTGSQVVELAMQVEKSGAAFYEAARKTASTDEARRVFDYLISEERRHLATFQGMLSKLELVRPAQQYEGEWDAYLKVAAREHVFADQARAESIIAGIKSPADAINYAINFEKDSILLFFELSNLVAGGTRDVVMKLVDEEKDHLRRLSELKRILK